jgi:hypothetical protein
MSIETIQNSFQIIQCCRNAIQCCTIHWATVIDTDRSDPWSQSLRRYWFDNGCRKTVRISNPHLQGTESDHSLVKI